MKCWIVIVGNPVHGFKYIGPFTDTQAAADFGNDDNNMLEYGGDWWIAEVTQP